MLEREVAALAEAAVECPRTNLLLLTLTRHAVPDELPRGIRALTAYEWTLASDDGGGKSPD